MKKSFEELLAEATAAVPSISAQQAREQMLRDPEVVFLDPRKAEDISASTGIIPGALNVTLDVLSEKPDSDLPRPLHTRSRPIITSCEAGPMAAIAAYALKLRGFSNVSFIDGGTRGWLDAGYATAR